MKAPQFDLRMARSVDEATDMLTSYDGEAKVLAGGQSLVPLLNFRLLNPEALIDINGVAELGGYRLDGETLRVSATCRHRDIELDRDISSRCPAIADAVGQIGHTAIRNRGTVVGSIAHADPAAEWPGLALLLDATLEIRSADGAREAAASSFFEGFLSTSLEPTEMLTAVRFALTPASGGSAWVEFARRHGDFALIGVGAVIDRPDGTIRDARIVVVGAAATAVRIAEAEQALLGAEPSASAFAEAAHIVSQSVDPASDIHGDSAYRRRLCEVLTRRALAAANARAA